MTPAEEVAAQVAERARLFGLVHLPPPLPPIPDIPLERYDVCICGSPRFMHGPGGLPAGEFGDACPHDCDQIVVHEKATLR